MEVGSTVSWHFGDFPGEDCTKLRDTRTTLKKTTKRLVSPSLCEILFTTTLSPKYNTLASI